MSTSWGAQGDGLAQRVAELEEAIRKARKLIPRHWHAHQILGRALGPQTGREKS